MGLQLFPGEIEVRAKLDDGLVKTYAIRKEQFLELKVGDVVKLKEPKRFGDWTMVRVTGLFSGESGQVIMAASVPRS